MNIVLIGYMGSGKSTIGKELATLLNFSFLDLDNYMSDKENASIPEIFKTKGEIYFRKKETQYLNQLINIEDNTVIALGGGTPCYGTNMNSLLDNPNVVTFYLKLSIPQLVKRLFNNKATRPLISHLKTEDELLEFIGKHLFERTHYYNKAHYVINADSKTQQDILETIVTKLI